MSLEKATRIDKIEVLEDGVIQTRTAEIIIEDGVEISRRYVDRQVLKPGISTEGLDQRIKDVAKAVWAQDVISAYDAKLAFLAGE